MDKAPINRRLASVCLLLIGTLMVTAGASLLTIAVANWLARPFPAIPAAINQIAHIYAAIAAITAALCVWFGLSLRR